MSPGLRYQHALRSPARAVAVGLPENESVLQVGAVQSIGLRGSPLIQLELTRLLSIDGYATVGWNFTSRTTTERYMLGFTLTQ